MTYSIILFARRNPSLSPSEFKAHYEGHHVPLLQRVGGSKFPISHTRHYVDRSSSPEAGTSPPFYPATVLWGKQEDFDYDCVAQLTFENEEKFKVFMGALQEEPGKSERLKDEEYMLDPGTVKVVVVGDTISTAGPQ